MTRRKPTSSKSTATEKAPFALSRRGFLKVGAAGLAASSVPSLFIPNRAIAQTGGRGTIKHLLYVRLSGGFRFPTAFNADVSGAYNPFGSASGVPSGVDWGVSNLLMRAGFLDANRTAAGMQPVHQLADRITVMPTVDHEPLAGYADGNHTTGLERYYTGYVNGSAGFFTRINLGLADRYATALSEGRVLLPPFVMGGAAMARGLGAFAPYRPPVLSGGSFDRFAASAAGAIPDWGRPMVTATDARMRDRQHLRQRDRVDAYVQSRAATEAYAQIFADPLLATDRASDTLVDGISNTELSMLFGTSSSARDIRLALRLFHFGCPAVYLDQGGYDYHSGEQDRLPGSMEALNQLTSALINVLPRMSHPDGGTYWDHTLVVYGSEFSRTARGDRFNSARGSDHNGDNSTRWMSMPFFGGPVPGGRMVGATTARDDLRAEGTVYSYRSVLNTLMDGLGCDPEVAFPADPVVPDLFG
ncbi:MAG: DUF1501 domain-containing protein [Myxococcales bacterium]|nr:DUF1501 domain-containing protein [Myxococcales bacterium]MCB9626355.1 DUF1501 domain-containing protein [Sandaracinaceae bacterium]